MLSRIFWIAMAGIALVGGIILQEGGGIFSWSDDRHESTRTKHAIDARIEQAVVGSVDKMQIIDADGRRIDVSRESRHALGEAIGRLAKAEAHLAILGVRDAGDEEIEAAKIRRDQARTEVETLKARIEQQEDVSERDRDALRDQIRREVRDDVRSAIRDVVRD